MPFRRVVYGDPTSLRPSVRPLSIHLSVLPPFTPTVRTATPVPAAKSSGWREGPGQMLSEFQVTGPPSAFPAMSSHRIFVLCATACFTSLFKVANALYRKSWKIQRRMRKEENHLWIPSSPLGHFDPFPSNYSVCVCLNQYVQSLEFSPA